MYQKIYIDKKIKNLITEKIAINKKTINLFEENKSSTKICCNG